MHIGLIGLGRMGANMRARLRASGIEVTGYDRNPEVSDVADVSAMLGALGDRKIVWVMVPAGEVTESVVQDLAGRLCEDDVIIDGGNSRYQDDIRLSKELSEKRIHYVDAGVSGGIWGKDVGYGLMVGGEDDVIVDLMPIFDSLRPEGPREEGFVHAGPVGAGHYAKMIHNGVEYGLMQAYAEGYEILAARDDLIPDVDKVFQAWQRGTVVRSWLLELLIKALNEDPHLHEIQGFVADSGEGRWTVKEAIEQSVPAPVISAALFARFESRQEDSPAMRAVAALRQQFGGHGVKAAGDN